uniref:Uncharacterized protein n=1 Tax=Acrobeloides nanus TaxID=290746 RepID=A0A914DJH4_9BILA
MKKTISIKTMMPTRVMPILMKILKNPNRRRPTRFRDATLSSTTSIRSPTNRLIAYRLDEGENFDKNDYGGKSRTSSHSRKNRRRHEDYYDDVEDEKKSGEKSTENQETSTESQEISTHLLVASQETTIRSPTHRLISYRLEESDHTPTHQFQKAKKAAYDFNLSRRVKRATKKVEETRTRKKDFVDDDDDDLYSYYQWRLRRARLLRRLRELDAESLRPTPTCCRSYRNPRYYPSYYQQPYYGRSPYYSYPSYGTYYPSYGGYGGYGGYRPLGGYGGYPPQALDLGIGWGVNVGVPAAGLGVGVNSGLGVTVG